MLKQLKKHYHWVVALALLLMMAIRGGTNNNLPSLHLILVTEGLEITRAQFSVAASASSVVMMLSGLMIGIVARRVDYRYVMTAFMLLGAVSYVIMEKATGYAMFFLGYLLVGLCHGFCGEAGTTRMVNAWFHKHRGTVLGAVMSATGLGGSITCIFQAAAIERGGYRASFRLVAILMGICGILAFVFLRDAPQKIGLKPYGEGGQLGDKMPAQKLWLGLPMRQLTRRPAFYMMLFGTLFSAMIPNMAFAVVVPYLQDSGLSFGQASKLQSVLLLCLAGAKILTGYLCDTLGAKKTTLLCMSLNVVSLTLLAMSTGIVSATVAVVIFALAVPITTVTVPLLASSLFGYQAQGSYIGIFISMVSASTILANLIANIVYDCTGTYRDLLLFSAGLMVVMMGMYLMMYRLADNDRKNFEANENTTQ